MLLEIFQRVYIILIPVVWFDVKMVDDSDRIASCKMTLSYTNTLNNENIFTCQITSEPENTRYKFLTIFKGSFFI